LPRPPKMVVEKNITIGGKIFCSNFFGRAKNNLQNSSQDKTKN
jgi:hypothetical protein